MKNFIIPLLLTFVFLSCSKDHEDTLKLTDDSISKRSLESDQQTTLPLEDLSVTFSRLICNTRVLTYVQTQINSNAVWQENASIPLFNLMTSSNEETSFRTLYNTTLNSTDGNTETSVQVSFDDIMNNILPVRPDLSISIFTPGDEGDIRDNVAFVNAVDYEADYYKKYLCGGTGISVLADEEPEETVFVLQEAEGFFTATDTELSVEEYYVQTNTMWLFCSEIVNNLINANLNQLKNQSTIVIDGTTYNNPLSGRNIISRQDIIEQYNANCSGDIADSPLQPVTFRSTCERDDYENNEFIQRFKVPGGKRTLNHKKFCRWYKRWCEFQVDMVIAYRETEVSSTFALDNVKKFVSGRRRTLKKSRWWQRQLLFPEWLYLEGNNGYQTKYNWTAVHPRNGDTETFDIGFSATVKFVIESIEQAITGSTKLSTKRSFKDIDFGNDVVRYCDGCNSNNWYGDEYSTGRITWNVRERGNN